MEGRKDERKEGGKEGRLSEKKIQRNQEQMKHDMKAARIDEEGETNEDKEGRNIKIKSGNRCNCR